MIEGNNRKNFTPLFKNCNYFYWLFFCLWAASCSIYADDVLDDAVIEAEQAQYRTRVDAKLKHLLKEAVEDTSGFTDRFDAEVWLLDMSTRMARQVPDPEERMEILTHVHREASKG